MKLHIPYVDTWWQSPTAHDALQRERSFAGWAKRIAYRRSIGRKHIAPGGLWEEMLLVMNGLPFVIDDNTDPHIYASIHVGGYLNPDWVETLMGFPQGWTDVQDEL